MPDHSSTRPSPTSGSAGTWIARLGAFPLIALTATGVALIAYGILIGSIHEIHKYGHEMISRASNPMAFWFAVAYHTFVVLFLAYITYTCLRTAGWIRQRKAIESFANRVGTSLDPQRRLSPLVAIAILGAFFFMLYYIFQKWH